jgi:hypothetical protein
MSRKPAKSLKLDALPKAPEPITPAEAAVAQRLIDSRERRMKPPQLQFDKLKDALQISFEGDDSKRALLAMHSVTGLRNTLAVDLLIEQLTRLAGADITRLDPKHTNHAIALLDELEPSDGPEALLASQMVAVHLAAMDCYSRALLPGQSLAARELNLKHAGKLSRIYAEQLAALDKHRRKGQQTVVVEHVHVHEGGQAIVGAVSHELKT